MKVLIISPGKAHDVLLADAIGEYEKRLQGRFPIEWNFPKPGDKETEGEAIKKLLKPDDFVVLLDERGKDMDTPGLAALLDKHLQAGTKRIVFLIGGAFGVDRTVQDWANQTLKLSSLVFPHMLVRLILAEQLYRATTILDGGKYHHA
jgi:23S rRNA (pseudouridine1915-N3)-methyltransferase